MRKFSGLLLALPFVELYLLIKMGSQLGALTVVLWVVLSIFIGMVLIKNAGIATAFLVRERLQRGERPDAEMLTGLLWVIAGALLIFPGPLTDVLGLICVLPITRNWLAARLLRGFAAHGGFAGRDSGVIEGEFTQRSQHDDQRLR